MSSIRPRRVQIASQSDVGRVRSVNQDVCGQFENLEGYRLLVVADGMGGHAGGETASQLALETIGQVFERDFGEPDTLLARALRAANDEIHRVGALDPALHGMGTTGVAAKRLGRRFVGIELSEEYIRLARNKLEMGGRKGRADVSRVKSKAEEGRGRGRTPLFGE